MSKVRVYELARELNMESKMLVSRLKGMGIDVASHQSTLTGDQIIQAKKALQTTASGGTVAPAREPAPKVVIRRRRPGAGAEDEAQGADHEEAAAHEAAAAEPAVEARRAPDVMRREESRGAPVEAASESPSETQAAEEAPATLEQRPAVVRRAASEAEAKPQEAEAGKPSAREEAPTARVVQRAEQSAETATIIRRASPDEVRAVRSREAPRGGAPATGDGRRPAGAGPGARPAAARDERPGFKRPAEPGESGDLGLSDEAWESRGRGKDKKRDPKKLTEAEEAARRAVHKIRRDNVNTRVLLNQVVDPELEEAAPGPAAKKVYMPSAPNKKRDLKRRKNMKKTQITTPRAAYRIVKMGAEITVGELAKQLSIKASEIIKKLMTQGVMATINQPVDFDTATLISTEFGYEVQSNVVSVDEVIAKSRNDAQSGDLVERSPIVTIMGHVDHGKTSILDAIRQAKVAEGEAGGITQHIGAYSVEHGDRNITFLDTPGHEAFSAMRARGANVTDIVILVVAADDGVMPQTVEAISHAKNAGVPIIVAVNKMDKPNLNLDRIYTELMEHGIQSEEWGGETQFVKVSALQRTGLDELLEAVLLQAEILELEAAPSIPAEGTVVEAHLDKGRGPVATLVVQNGTMRIGDTVVAGMYTGKVRAMQDHTGKRLEEAGPSTPVEVIGLSGVPMAGDPVHVVADEKVAKEIAEMRISAEARRTGGKSSAKTFDELLSRVQQAEVLEVPVIVKADTQGSVEALSESILKLNTDRVRNRIVHKAVGGVSESEIQLAVAANAIIIAFNVRAQRGLDDFAEQQGVPIKYFSVIYDVVDALKSIMAGKLPPILKEVITGHAEVRQTISVPKVGVVAGSAVTDGKITRNAHLRLIRDDVVIYGGKIGSLRRFKDDVKEVAQGYECGISIDGYNDIREGDVIEAYIIEEHAPTL